MNDFGESYYSRPPQEGDVAYELRWRSEGERPATEVARLLSAEFAYTNVDTQDGLKRARAQAEWIEQAPPRLFLGHHQKALEAARRLKSLAPGEALTVEFGDDRDSTLKAIVMPGETIKFGFRSNAQQEAARPLAERCALALNCELVVI